MSKSDDVISRQTAIDALDALCQEHRYKIPGKRETYSQYNEAWQDALDRAEGAICDLPSAQPFHNITMNDVLKYIDGMPENVWQEFTACLECRGWELQRRTTK